MSGPTDEELDRDWQPNGRRPQSTIARSFSQELMDIFKIENSIADLGEQVDKRKQQVTTQTSELESLEARIREMEERLKRNNGAVPTTGGPQVPRQPLADTTGANKEAAKTSRPGTAKQSHQQAPVRGGAMPPTPTASEGECDESVDSEPPHRHSDDEPPSTTTAPSVATKAARGRSPGAASTRTFADYVMVNKDGGDRDI